MSHGPASKMLVDLRHEIAQLDAQMILCLLKRLQCAEAIAECKFNLELPLRAPDAEHSVMERNLDLAKQLGLAKPLVSALTQFLIEASVHSQETYLAQRLRELGDDEKTGADPLPRKPQTRSVR